MALPEIVFPVSIFGAHAYQIVRDEVLTSCFFREQNAYHASTGFKLNPLGSNLQRAPNLSENSAFLQSSVREHHPL